MASGIYTTATDLAVKNHKYTFVPDASAKPVFAGSFYSENPEIFSGSFSFDGVDFDLTNAAGNVLQLKKEQAFLVLKSKMLLLKVLNKVYC